MREYTYVPQGSGIVYITITHRMHADRLRNAPGRAADVSARPNAGYGTEAAPARAGVCRRAPVCIRRVPACAGAVSSASGACRRVCAGASRLLQTCAQNRLEMPQGGHPDSLRNAPGRAVDVSASEMPQGGQPDSLRNAKGATKRCLILIFICVLPIARPWRLYVIGATSNKSGMSCLKPHS